MKKTLRIFAIMITLVLFVSGCKTAEEGGKTIDTFVDLKLAPVNYEVKQKINVYFFYGDGCHFCAAAENFFKNIEEEYGDCYNLVKYETWNDSKNSATLTKMFEEFNIAQKDRGVPFIGIGDYHETGYVDSMAQDLLEKITNACSDPDYEDVVGPLIPKK